MDKIYYMSDLHLEGTDNIQKFVDTLPNGYMLILAGDIVSNVGTVGLNQQIAKLKDLQHKFQHVIYVAGNHDYYGLEYVEGQKLLKQLMAERGIVMLENEVYEVYDKNKFNAKTLKFYCTTLWTNFWGMHPELHTMLIDGLTDFRMISHEGENGAPGPIYPYHMVEKYDEAVKFLKDGLTLKDHEDWVTKIAVTHFPPSRMSIDPMFRGDKFNCYFANDIDDVVQMADVWIHGHTHCSHDYKCGPTPVLCNPKGWDRYAGDENDEFDINKHIHPDVI